MLSITLINFDHTSNFDIYKMTAKPNFETIERRMDGSINVHHIKKY